MLAVFLVGLVGSCAGFFLSSFLAGRGHVERGQVQLHDTAPLSYKIVFVTRYRVTPQVKLTPHGDMDHRRSGQYWFPHCRKFRVDLTKVTTAGFTATVVRLPWNGDGKGEDGATGYVYKLPLEAKFDWRAEGIPDPQFDTRSAWLKLTLPQRVFSVAGLLFLLGIAADLLGILSASLQLAGG